MSGFRLDRGPQIQPFHLLGLKWLAVAGHRVQGYTLQQITQELNRVTARVGEAVSAYVSAAAKVTNSTIRG
jgi:hypothetical protein